MTDDELIAEAAALLDDARCSLLDPALRREWALRRRRWRFAMARRATHNPRQPAG